MDKILKEEQLDFDDVLIKQQISNINSRSEVNLETNYNFKYSSIKYSGVPIMASNMGAIGTFEMANAFNNKNMFSVIRKYYSKNELEHFFKNKKDVNNIAISCGLRMEDLEKLNFLMSLRDDINYICLDIANGGIQKFHSFIGYIREKYPEKVIIAGNVSTGELTEEIIKAGADIVKVGVGSGSACTTRLKTSVGRPQLSVIMDCSEAAHNMNAHIISDGGIKEVGHIGVGFAGGADFVMLGGMLSGTEQTFGSLMDINGKRYKKFYGDSSGDKDVNPVSESGTPEGRQTLVEYKGDVNNILNDIIGGLKSTCTYTNASNIEELKNRAQFYKVDSNQKLNRSIIDKSTNIALEEITQRMR